MDILIIDDENDIRNFLVTVAQRKGYSHIAVGTGREAIQHASQEWPRVVMLDIRLPDMRGWEVWDQLEAIRNGRPLKVIALSATIMQDELDQIKARHPAAVLQKPILPAECMKVLADVLQQNG